VHVELLHPGCLSLAWDGDLLVAGLGHLWRLSHAGWRPEPLRALHRVHHRGPTRTVEVHGGYLYVEGRSGWRATARTDGDDVLPHPSGAVALARHGVVHRAAAPGRSPLDVPELRGDSVRFGPEGGQLLGLSADGPVQVDLQSGRAHPLSGVPLGVGVVLVNGRALRCADGTTDEHVLASGLVEASPAVGPAHLAGPGGRLWSLHDGTPSPHAPIVLGATVAVGDGFATVAFEAIEGVLVDASGAVEARFDVPVEDDDMVVSMRVEGGSLWADTAWGRRLHLLNVDAPSTVAATALTTVHTPVGPLDDAVVSGAGDHRVAASESGWLLSWPAADAGR